MNIFSIFYLNLYFLMQSAPISPAYTVSPPAHSPVGLFSLKPALSMVDLNLPSSELITF